MYNAIRCVHWPQSQVRENSTFANIIVVELGTVKNFSASQICDLLIWDWRVDVNFNRLPIIFSIIALEMMWPCYEDILIYLSLTFCHVPVLHRYIAFLSLVRNVFYCCSFLIGYKIQIKSHKNSILFFKKIF